MTAAPRARKFWQKCYARAASLKGKSSYCSYAPVRENAPLAKENPHTAASACPRKRPSLQGKSSYCSHAPVRENAPLGKHGRVWDFHPVWRGGGGGGGGRRGGERRGGGADELPHRVDSARCSAECSANTHRVVVFPHWHPLGNPSPHSPLAQLAKILQRAVIREAGWAHLVPRQAPLQGQGEASKILSTKLSF